MIAAAVALPRADTARATGSLPAPVLVGYVPMPADDLVAAFDAVNPAAGDTLDVTVGITSAAAGAVLVYDHWEDGFEPDLTNPAQSSTLVWGDGDGANGDAAAVCSTCAGDLVPQGAVFVMRNDVATPRNPTTVLFDGRDKVASTRGFALTAAAWTTNLGSVLASAVSAYDRSKYGTDFVVPVGEDTPAPSGGTPAFEYTGATVMAAFDDTVVGVDVDGDGTVDTTATIDEGETSFTNGGLLEGARITSSKPVQVHLVTGDVGSSYESRSYLLFPTELLTNDYVNPVGTTVANQPTAIYLHNPSGDPLTVDIVCPSCSTPSVTLAAGATDVFLVPAGEAVRFSSPVGTVFTALGAVGSYSGAVGAGGDQSTNFDWGFTLVPTRLLTTQVVLGWAPGNSDDPPSDDDDDPVWVAAMADTDVRIDFDGDPSTGAFGPDACYGRYDTEIAITALTSNRLTDTSDNDMTGARIYTCDGTALAGAWGEDPANAPTGTPGLDAGYTLIPSTTMVVDKLAVLVADADGDGRAGPGDTLEYRVDISDAGSLAFTNVAAADPLGSGMTYVAGSTELVDLSGTTPVADDGPPAATPFPLDEAGLALPDLAAGETYQLRYRVTVDRPFPLGPATLVNEIEVTANEADAYDRLTIALPVNDVSLTVAESASPSVAGDDATFVVTVTNAGPDGATATVVTAPVPTGSTFVAATPSVGTYDDTTGRWDVGDLAAGATATLQLVATVGEPTVELFAEVTDAGGVDVDSRPAEDAFGPADAANQDDEATVAVTVSPRIDLSLTKVVLAGPTTTGQTAFTLTLTNGGPSTATGITVADRPAAGTTPIGATASVGTFDESTGSWTIPSLAPGASATLQLVQTVVTFPSVHLAEVTAANETDVDSAPAEDPLGPSAAPNQDDEATVTVTATASVAGAVWLDLDADGSTDGDEPGLADVTVTLTFAGPDATFGTGDDVETVRTTDTDGTWSATGLTPGSYRAAVDTTTLPFGATTATYDLDGTTTPQVAAFTLTPLQARTGVDFGEAGAGRLGGTVFEDVDDDGLADTGEGLGGITVVVTWAGPDGVAGTGDDHAFTVTTTGNGSWTAPSLPAGGYAVVVDRDTVPTALTIVVVDPDSTLDAATDITIASGATVDDLDVGFRRPPTINLGITQSIDEPVEVGGTTTIRLSVRNTGDAVTGPVVVTNTLPAGLRFVSADAPGFTCSASGQVVTCTHPGPIAPDATLPLRFVVAVDAPGPLQNTVTVSVNGDTVPSDNQAVSSITSRVPTPTSTPTTTTTTRPPTWTPTVTAPTNSFLPRTGAESLRLLLQLAGFLLAAGGLVVGSVRLRRVRPN